MQDAILGDEERATGRTACRAGAGLRPRLYHREVPPAERAAALDAMRSRCMLLPAAAGLCMHCHSREQSHVLPCADVHCGEGLADRITPPQL